MIVNRAIRTIRIMVGKMVLGSSWDKLGRFRCLLLPEDGETKARKKRMCYGGVPCLRLFLMHYDSGVRKRISGEHLHLGRPELRLVTSTIKGNTIFMSMEAIACRCCLLKRLRTAVSRHLLGARSLPDQSRVLRRPPSTRIKKQGLSRFNRLVRAA